MKTRLVVAECLLAAETELRLAQLEHDGTPAAATRYRAAKVALEAAQSAAEQLLQNETPAQLPALLN